MLTAKLSREATHKRKVYLLACLLLTLFVALLGGGGNRVDLQSALCAVIILSTVVASLWVPRGRASKSPLAWLPMLFWAMAGLCFIQLLSFPCGVLSVIAPISGDFYAAATLALGAECRGAISINQPATLLAALWFSTLALWSWMLITVTHANETRRQYLGVALIFIALFQAAYGLIMQLSGLEYGAFLEPKLYYRGHATGTLVNRNHFATLMYVAMSLALPALIESGVRAKGVDSLTRLVNWATSPKILIRLAIVVFAIATVNSHSRMGNVAFALGLTIACLLGFVCALMPGLSRGLASARYFIFLVLSVALIDFVVVSNWFGLEQVVTRIENTTAASEERDEIVNDVLTSNWLTANKLAGTGGGSFEHMYRQYESVPRLRRVDHAHNDGLQFWLEYGVVGCALLVVGLSLLLRAMTRIPRPQAIALISLLCMLAAHGVVDFSLRVPAIGMFVVAAFVYLLTAPNQKSKRRRSRREKA